LTPAEQLVVIDEDACFDDQPAGCPYGSGCKPMAAQDMGYPDARGLADADIAYLEDVFIEQVFPVLSPAIDPHTCSCFCLTKVLRSRSNLNA
jgi:polyphosphate kinase